jgi:hypothetical protein
MASQTPRRSSTSYEQNHCIPFAKLFPKIEGAFKFMQHDHFFLALSETSTEMRDRFTIEAPLPALGFIGERLFLRRYIDRFLSRRNEDLKQIAESDRWRDFLPKT